jgi:3'-phosphoadenosine 5'-phosphosulfate sulfotransferase (PAPS reductase)/FAD synthetase
MRVIVALSGGKASAWCANWAFDNYRKEDIVLYFNDTKWEHKDLYRFLSDLSVYFDHPITSDSDGRSVDELFFDKHAIANNRMPFCSRILKADRLQKYYNDGDTIIFGIGPNEIDREDRLNAMYLSVGNKRKAWADLRFPLIENEIGASQVNEWLKSIGIEEPEIYKIGFEHNNCSGGCVRAGKKQWKMLYERLPEVYAQREQMEESFMEKFKKRATIFKDESLKEFRHRIETGQLSNYYNEPSGKQLNFECVGICDSEN